MSFNEHFKLNYSTILNLLFFSIPIGLAIGPLIAEILLNLFTILIIFEIIKKNEFKIFRENIFIYFYLFYTVVLLSAILSQNEIIIAKAFFYLRLILFLISAKYFFENKHFNKKLSLISLIFLMIIFVDAQFQIFTGVSLFGNKGQYHHQDHFNISGIFFDEEILGSYLSRILPIINFFIIIYFRKKISLSIGLIIFFVALWTTLFTGERVALVILLLNLIVFIFYIKKIKILLSIVFLAFLIFVSSIKFNEKVYSRIIETTKNQIFHDNKIYWISETHTNHIISSYYIFLDNKIFGSGPRSFRIECKKYQHIVKGCSTHPHNIFMQILTETGMIGFGIFIFGIFWLYKLFFINLINFFRNKNPSDYLYFIPIASIIIQFLPFLPSGNFFNNWLSIIFFYTFSIIFIDLRKY